MKNVTLLLFCIALFLPVIAFPSNTNGAPAHDGETSFKDIEEKEWFLWEVKSAGKSGRMDREKLAADNMGGVYTINFQKDQSANGSRASGMGAPNRYFGPYSAGNNRSLSIGNLASTYRLMSAAAIF